MVKTRPECENMPFWKAVSSQEKTCVPIFSGQAKQHHAAKKIRTEISTKHSLVLMRYEKGVFLVIVTLEFGRLFSNLPSMIQRLKTFLPQAMCKKNLNRGVLGQIILLFFQHFFFLRLFGNFFHFA
jgi:hypothetical protein